ncbi:MAG: DUF1570 domain-containing protein [Phycisphaerales bacterium]|nr:MAG: DUF1570 domain-containing protein [Phycisphaerales bacterium]
MALAPLLSVVGCATNGTPQRIEVWTGAWSEEGLTGRRFVTEHFEIVTTLRDAEFEAALPRFLEAAYKRYAGTIAPPEDVESKLTTYVFNTRSEWVRFARRRFPARYEVYSRIRSGGFTESHASVLFYVSRGTTLATLAHEGWHQYVGSRFDAPIPAWLDEGLACYHEAVEFAGAVPRFTPQRNTLRINSLREAVQTGTDMSLREIIDTNAGRIIMQHHSGITQLYYAQAWALVTFLRHGAGGRFAAAFDRMLDDIADGTLSVRVSAAGLGAAGGSDLTFGEAVFRAYFDQRPEELSEQYYDHLVRVAGF